MWLLHLSTFLVASIILINGNTLTTLKQTFSSATTQKPSICDSPLPPIEPEMCCEFPIIFNENVVQKCEMDFTIFDKTVSEIVTDSCIVDCIFNKSKMGMISKKTADIQKFFLKNVNDSNIWKSITLSEAVTTCLKEAFEEEIDEIEQNIKLELISANRGNMTCNPIPSIFLDCYYRELFKKCPNEKLATGNAACMFLKNYTIQCGDW